MEASHASEKNRIALLDDFLIRKRLDTKLDACLHDPLIIVEAAGGFGKSSLIASFLQRKNLATIWMPLSDLDNFAPRLWKKFTARIAYLNKALGDELSDLGFPESISLFDKVIGLIYRTVAIQGPMVLVLDDFYFINNKSILDFFRLLIEAAIPDLSIIIISRRYPLLNVKNHVIKRGHISHKDLQFTEQEIEDYYLNLLKITLPKNLITKVFDYSNGCIAVVYLIGLSLKNHNHETIYDISRLKLDVMQLINEYSFLRLSEELQKLFVKISLLDDFPYELLLILAEKNQALMEELMLANNFVIFDAFSGYIHIHHIFLEFLSSRQHFLSGQEILDVHKTAGDWYFSMKLYTDAIGHYQKIDDYEKIIEVVGSFPKQCTFKQANFGIDVIRKLPPAVVEQNLKIALTYNIFLMNNFYLEDAARVSWQLVKKCESLPMTEEKRSTLGEVYILLGFNSLVASLYDNQKNFIEYYKKADELLPEGSKQWDNTLHFSYCNYAVSIRDASEGSLERRISDLAQALPHIASAMHGCSLGMTEFMRTEQAFFTLDLNLASKYAHQAILESRKSNQYDIEISVLFYLMRMSIMKGDFGNTLSHFTQISQKQVNHDFYVAKEVYEGWFYLTLGQPEKLARWLKGVTEEYLVDTPIILTFSRLVRAKYYLATQKYDELFAYLENPEQYTLENFFLGAIEINLIKAFAYYQTSAKEKAVSMLEEAYDLALPNRILAPFVEGGKSMRTLATFLLSNGKTHIPSEWLEKISMKSSTYAKKLNTIVSAYQMSPRMEQAPAITLSKRESEVLNDVSMGLTREEIADVHHLSVNTVKNIMKSVFDKLGASNAYEAIRIAALKNLLK